MAGICLDCAKFEKCKECGDKCPKRKPDSYSGCCPTRKCHPFGVFVCRPKCKDWAEIEDQGEANANV